MSPWHPQHFEKAAIEAGGDINVIKSAVAVGRAVVEVNPNLTPVYTLAHLAHLTDVPYNFLRDVVSRRIDPYRSFRIPKSVAESIDNNYRLISIPDFQLLKTQRWLAKNILVYGRPHTASAAYAPNCDIKDTASLHCGARWLIKLDIKRFFESVSEISIYRVFRELGYQPLVAFEFSRLCTRQRKTWPSNRRPWQPYYGGWSTIPAYHSSQIGYLPQGAPTSPMAANLAVKFLDRRIAATSEKYGLVYTRYADDLALSTRDKEFTRETALRVIGEIYENIGLHGFSPNFTKTRILSPGSRKIILGLLVNGKAPRLTREFRARIRMHLHYLAQFGPVSHQRNRKFISVRSLRNHIEGLVNFAQHIEPHFAQSCRAKLTRIKWPL
jgi:retron-type reverse transcriptase